MSRWSDQFESHAVHQTLQQTRDWLDVEVEDIDSEQEAEKRRLIKALDAIKEMVDGLDPEFFPEQQLTQLNNHLRHQHFWNQIQEYSSSPSVQLLRSANDHLTSEIPTVYQLAKLALQPAARKSIKAVEDAYDAFCKTIEKRESEFESRLAENDGELTELDRRASELQDALKKLKETTDTTLSGWQNEFTTAQTTRAEEHSEAQIERRKNFDEALREWRAKSETEIKDISAKHNEKLQGAFDKFKEAAAARTEDMKAKHAAILEIHGLVGTDGVAGGYQKGATDEHDAANLWRIIAMASLGLAAGWIQLKYWLGFDVTAAGGVNWAEVITASSLTLVLLAAAGYASRQSKLHREAEQHMRWFALEVKAIDPFLSSLPEDQQNELKKQLSQKLFGQNRITSDQSDGSVDPNAFKAMVESILSPVQEIIKLVGKQ